MFFLEACLAKGKFQVNGEIFHGRINGDVITPEMNGLTSRANSSFNSCTMD